MDILGSNSPVLMELLSARVKDRVINTATLVSYTDGQLVHNRGDSNPGITIVKTGQVRVGTFGINGDFIPVAIIGPGVCLGEQMLYSGLPRIVDCFAVGPTELYQIPASKFRTLFDTEPELARALLMISNVRIHGCLEFIDDLRRLPLPVRTAKLIMALLKFESSATTIHTLQSDLANTLGVSRVSLGKALKHLENDNFIETGYREIIVRDIDKLSSWVEQHYEVPPIKADYSGWPD